jgi:hypothetical protein
MVSAVTGGSIPMLNFLVREGCQFHEETFAAAASAGSIPVSEYLIEHGEEGDVGPCWLNEAANSGHLHVLQWVADNDDDGASVTKWDDRDLCSSAAQSGNIEMMQFLQRRGADLFKHNISSDIRWAEASITTAAARCERKQMLLWLKQQGILPTVHAMLDAARFDMLDMCLFLHTECDCPWDANLLTTSAHNDYFELVKALYERGSPIEIHPVRLQAARYGRLDILQYLVQLPDEPQCSAEQLTELLNTAAVFEQIAIATWLRQQQRAEWPEVLLTGNTRWRGKVLQWALLEGCTSILQALDG